METIALEELKYPAGKFKMPESFTDQDIKERINIIQDLPALLSKEVSGLDEANLNYLHRPDGWTVRQLTHHLADSHMNAFIRIKLALTEDNPNIKPYIESEWAKLADNNAPAEASLKILDGVHLRWVTLLKSLKSEDLSKTVVHPEFKRQMTIGFLIYLYSWHCGHHLAHIKNAKKFKNQF
jgi:hypothetical protein